MGEQRLNCLENINYTNNYISERIKPVQDKNNNKNISPKRHH